MEDCSPKPKADRRYGSKIDPYAHLVDGWLEADRLLPRKQRHTIRRVHDRLYFVKSVFRVGAGAVLLDSSLIPSPPIMPQDEPVSTIHDARVRTPS